MTKDDLNDLQQAINLIFAVEQRWRDADKGYAADILYKARTEINNARSRG